MLPALATACSGADEAGCKEAGLDGAALGVDLVDSSNLTDLVCWPLAGSLGIGRGGLLLRMLGRAAARAADNTVLFALFAVSLWVRVPFGRAITVEGSCTATTSSSENGMNGSTSAGMVVMGSSGSVSSAALAGIGLVAASALARLKLAWLHLARLAVAQKVPRLPLAMA